MATSVLTIIVPGTPRPKGSWRPMKSATTGRSFVKPTSEKAVNYQATIAAAAMQMRSDHGVALHDGPVMMNVTFVFARPKGHFGTGRNASTLKASAPQKHTQDPDRDKLLRTIQDALTGVLYRDDAQVYDGWTKKVWGEESTTIISVAME